MLADDRLLNIFLEPDSPRRHHTDYVWWLRFIKTVQQANAAGSTPAGQAAFLTRQAELHQRLPVAEICLWADWSLHP
jgi:hypothetical protein